MRNQLSQFHPQPNDDGWTVNSAAGEEWCWCGVGAKGRYHAIVIAHALENASNLQSRLEIMGLDNQDLERLS